MTEYGKSVFQAITTIFPVASSQKMKKKIGINNIFCIVLCPASWSAWNPLILIIGFQFVDSMLFGQVDEQFSSGSVVFLDNWWLSLPQKNKNWGSFGDTTWNNWWNSGIHSLRFVEATREQTSKCRGSFKIFDWGGSHHHRSGTSQWCGCCQD